MCPNNIQPFLSLFDFSKRKKSQFISSSISVVGTCKQNFLKIQKIQRNERVREHGSSYKNIVINPEAASGGVETRRHLKVIVSLALVQDASIFFRHFIKFFLFIVFFSIEVYIQLVAFSPKRKIVSANSVLMLE